MNIIQLEYSVCFAINVFVIAKRSVCMAFSEKRQFPCEVISKRDHPRRVVHSVF